MAYRLVDLTFDPGQPRDRDGRWTVAPGSKAREFTSDELNAMGQGSQLTSQDRRGRYTKKGRGWVSAETGDSIPAEELVMLDARSLESFYLVPGLPVAKPTPLPKMPTRPRPRSQPQPRPGWLDFAVTPGGRAGDASPLAKPGYTGGRKLTDQEREIAHALMRKGKSKRAAIRMARGLVNSAAHGGWGRGKKIRNAKVAAAAVRSVAQRKTF